MRITISGTPGSGKSSAARMLARKLGLKHISMGDFQRQIASEKGLTINQLSTMEEKDPELDRMVDKRQKDYGINEDDFIMDSRLAPLFIPHADLKVFLDCDIDERARRISGHNRKEEGGSVDKVKLQLIERERSEEKRFLEYYTFNYKDHSMYDLVLDTTSFKEGDVVDHILRKIQKNQKSG